MPRGTAPAEAVGADASRSKPFDIDVFSAILTRLTRGAG